MNTKLKLYPFGYVFSEGKLDTQPPSYVEEKIDSTYYYYFDEGTQHSISKNKDSFLIIHGDFVHIGIYNDIPQEDLTDTLLNLYINDYEEFLNTLDFIAGRFTIIVKRSTDIHIYPDATNGRSNYYTKDRVLASSHTKLIADILNYESIDHEELVKEKILLETPYTNINSTIPNHSVELGSKKITRFFPRRNNQFTQINEEKRFKLVEKFWKKQIDAYSNYDNRIIFSITGGLDSRFALSLSKKYMNDFHFFTYALKNKIDNSSPTSKMLSKDYGVVKQILSDIPLKHSFFFFEDNPVALTDEESIILGKNTISRHNPKLVKYAYNEFGSDLLHLRGNLLEIGQTYLHRRKEIENTKFAAKDAFMRVYKTQVKDPSQLEELYDKFEKNLGYLNDTYDYHLVDLVYWELRMGRWICEVSNNHDSIFRTINPFNHRALISISLSFPYEQRRDCYMFKEIINRNFPILNFYGINDLDNIYEQSKSSQTLPSDNNETTTSKKMYFDEFIINDNNNDITFKTKNKNELYLPKIMRKKDEYAELSIPFERENGIAYMTLNNNYSSRDFKRVIFYEIYKNDTLLLKEDISNWKLPNHISIPGLVKNDNIKIRLKIYKDLIETENWEEHSALTLLNIHQISSKMTDDNKINCSSPYSIK